LEDSLGLVTVWRPRLATTPQPRLQRNPFATGHSIREIVLKRKLMPEAELDLAMKPEHLTEPGLPLNERPGATS